MTEIKKNRFVRSARLAALSANIAGRNVVRLGKKITGAHSPDAQARDAERAAQQVFKVLGELKGGAMKLGQAMSVLEASLPDEAMAPYRESLVKLQDSAPPMSTSSVHQQMATYLGDDWRERFEHFDDEPAAAASLGQVHRGVWADGQSVAVKIQYPDAAEAFRADLATLTQLGRVAGAAMPGMDMAPLLAELRDRAQEELDYRLEGEYQRCMAEALAESTRYVVPQVVEATEKVLVTTWLQGVPMSTIIADGTAEQRNVLARRYLEFLLQGPEYAGLLHADPHPGNFRLINDEQLGVMDFGAVKQLPSGMPGAIGRLLRCAMVGDSDAVAQGLREEGFVKAAVAVDADELLDYLSPFLDPVRAPEFTFSREWMGELFHHVEDPRRPQWSMGLKLNLPAEYLLIHRVWSGGIGMLCQMNATVPVVEVFEELLPEFR